jgi:ankyrin repeat protein
MVNKQKLNKKTRKNRGGETRNIEISLQELINNINNENNENNNMNIHEAIKKIVNKNYDSKYIYPESGNTLLMEACNKNLPIISEKLCEDDNIDINHINNDGETALMLACKNKMEKTLSIMFDLYGNNVNVGQVSNDGNTALIYACGNNMPDIAFTIFNTKKSNEGQSNKYGYTALLFCCINYNKMLDFAIELIKKGKPNAGQTIKDKGINALMLCIEYNLYILANSIIDYLDDYGISQINYNGETPLIMCSRKKTEPSFEDIAIKLLETNESLPGHTNIYDSTALIYSVQNSYKLLAFKLIESGESNPNQLDSSLQTALFYACENVLNEIALKLLNIPDLKNIGVSNYADDTPLIAACLNNMSDVAIKIIETGESNPGSINYEYMTAYDFAVENEMKEVIKLLKNITPKKETVTISLNDVCRNPVELTEDKIGDWIKKKDNVVFKSPNSNIYYSTKKTILQRDIKNRLRIICKKGVDYQKNENFSRNSLIDDAILYHMKEIGMPIDFVLLTDILALLDNDKQLFYFKLSKKIPFTTISQWVYNQNEYYHRTGHGFADCNLDSGGNLYRIFEAEESTKERKRDISEIDEDKENNIKKTKIDNKTIVNIRISDNEKYQFEIINETTIGDLKKMLLERIIEKGEKKSPVIKLMMFLGKNYAINNDDNNNLIITQLPNFQNEMTFYPVQITNQTQSGGKTKKNKNKKKIRKNKSKQSRKKW